MEANTKYTKFLYLSQEDSTEKDLIIILRKIYMHHQTNHSEESQTCNYGIRYIPVVESHKSMILLYQIKVSDLKSYCEEYFGYNEELFNDEDASISTIFDSAY